MKRLPESRLVLLVEFLARFGVAHVVGVRAFRFFVEISGFSRSCRPAGKRGLDRFGEADFGGRQGGGAVGRDRGADTGRHAGDRDFQSALYRERRALHDGDVDVPFRHRYA